MALCLMKNTFLELQEFEQPAVSSRQRADSEPPQRPEVSAPEAPSASLSAPQPALQKMPLASRMVLSSLAKAGARQMQARMQAPLAEERSGAPAFCKLDDADETATAESGSTREPDEDSDMDLGSCTPERPRKTRLNGRRRAALKRQHERTVRAVQPQPYYWVQGADCVHGADWGAVRVPSATNCYWVQPLPQQGWAI